MGLSIKDTMVDESGLSVTSTQMSTTFASEISMLEAFLERNEEQRNLLDEAMD